MPETGTPETKDSGCLLFRHVVVVDVAAAANAAEDCRAFFVFDANSLLSGEVFSMLLLCSIMPYFSMLLLSPMQKLLMLTFLQMVLSSLMPIFPKKLLL